MSEQQNALHNAVDPLDAPIPLETDPRERLPEFPTEALPDSLLKAAREIARFDKVPLESPATVGLGVTATGLGKNLLIEERPGLEHHPSFFFPLIAPSGERKTPPFRKMSRGFTRFYEEMLPLYEQDRDAVDAHNNIINARVKKLTRQAERAENSVERRDFARQIANLKAELQTMPCDPRRFTSDYTEQVLFRLMEAHGGQYAVLSGEGRPVFDSLLGKYSGDGRTGDGLILAGISGDTITRDRIGSADTGGQESSVILTPCLNICVMIQHDKYLEAARHPALRASGALARIWPVWLPSLVGSRLESADEPGLDEAALKPFENFILNLLKQEREKPHRAVLSKEAAEIRRGFHNDIEQRLGQGGEFADVRDIASKACSQMVRLAGVLHVALEPGVMAGDRSEISVETMGRATKLGGYYLQQAVQSQRFADEDATLEPARRLLGWMKAERGAGRQILFSRADMQQRSPRPRPKAKELNAILELLVSHRWITEESGDGKPASYRLRG